MHQPDEDVKHQRRIRVLVVDDHEVLREGLVAILRAFSDLELIGATSGGAEALALCNRACPDVILMDLLMPEMDGIATTRAVRAEHPKVQVLLLTSFWQQEMMEAALQAGAAGCLPKNISASELVEAIRSAHA